MTGLAKLSFKLQGFFAGVPLFFLSTDKVKVYLVNCGTGY
jgi:hypothetical protein